MKMYTDEKGVSYYKRGNKFFSNTGWLEREISEKEFKAKTSNPIMDLYNQLMEVLQ